MKYITKYWFLGMIAFGLSAFVKPALCPLILGSFAFYMGFDAIRFQNGLEKKGITGTGKIVSFKSEYRGKTPIVEFTASAGELITEAPYLFASTDVDLSDNMIGNEISILYDADDPKRFILVQDYAFNNFAFKCAILIGLVFITLSICSLLGFINFK